MMLPYPGIPPAAAAPPPTDFFAILETLLYWKSSLLAHLDSVQTTEHLKELLESSLVSHTGAKGDLGSLGWELGVRHTILWTCMGPTFGLEPGSFRT